MNAISETPQLLDQHRRQYTYLRLSITDACNFRCNYCLPDGYCKDGQPEPLRTDEIARLVRAFAQLGTRKIRITGGEPSIRKDLAEIIHTCKHTPGIQQVALTSNGYRLANKLETLVEAGLDSLNLSADSLTPETFALITGRDKLDHVLHSIDRAFELGLSKVKLNAVLLRQYNGSELNKFLEFLRDKPITLRLIELMKTGDNTEFYQQQHIAGSEILKLLQDDNWLQVIREPDAGPAVEYTHPDYAGNIGLIMPYSKNFCASCNRLRVAANGQLHTCLFNQADADLRPLLQRDDQLDELIQRIRIAVAGKWRGHQLEQGYSGTTKHLAMLGG